MQLSAGRDLLIASVEESNSRFTQDKRHTWSNASTTQLGAEVSAGGDLTAVAGNDLAVIASRVQAGGDAALLAGNDLTLAAAADVSQSEYHYKSSRKKIHAETLTVRQQAADVEAGGSLTLAAGQDLTLVASAARAGDEAYLYAGRDLALLAAENQDYFLYDKKKKGSLGAKKTQRDEITTLTQIGSRVEAGGNLTLESGEDQRYQVARLSSGADLTLDAGGDIDFEGVKDLKQESHEKSSSSWAWTSAKGKGTTDETLRQSELVAAGNLVIEAAGKIRIDIPEVNAQTVTQTIDALVEAEPKLAWLKEMESRGDIDWQRVKEVHDQWKYSHSG
ncbi:filamentous hemagglutinin family protein, partial [Azoarcus indigens]|nr:filamentous hemagglutinin family protein [Azoarcus indigens]